VPDFLDAKREEIDARLAELKPVVDEYQRLGAAAAALAELNGSPGKGTRSMSSPTPRRGPGRPRGSASRASRTTTPVTRPSRKPASTTRLKGGRPKGSGTRAVEALSFIQRQPGITVPELAVKMGIKQNYLYRVLPILEQAGKIEKQGRGWHPTS